MIDKLLVDYLSFLHFNFLNAKHIKNQKLFKYVYNIPKIKKKKLIT